MRRDPSKGPTQSTVGCLLAIVIGRSVAMWPGMELCFVVPAFNAEASVGRVIADLTQAAQAVNDSARIWVVDDGSTDGTCTAARHANVELIRLRSNRGKGAALRAGLHAASRAGVVTLVSVDADGQHPAEEAVRIARLSVPDTSLILGVRDLIRDGAPRANQLSNAFSNSVLSLFTRQRLLDTQCGLRRYPVEATLQLNARDDGYAFESEVLMRACHAGLVIVQEPVRVIYPQGAARVSHFHVRRDPAKIVFRVVRTLLELPR